MMRVTTTYWKTQRKVGHLNKNNRRRRNYTRIIDETYKITEKPIYNTNYLNKKQKIILLKVNILIGFGLMKYGVELK